jgi:acylphosphatase
VIEGRVQGVGYRHFATRLASRFGVRGWVRNLDDGTVEVVASAPAEHLHAFRALLREGPRHGRVSGIAETGPPSDDVPSTFEVRF